MPRAATSSSRGNKIIISGFIKSDDCNLKLAAFTAIHAVSATFLLDDVVSCRSIARKKNRAALSRRVPLTPPLS